MTGLRYRSLSRDLEVDGASTDVDLTCFSAGVAHAAPSPVDEAVRLDRIQPRDRDPAAGGRRPVFMNS